MNEDFINLFLKIWAAVGPFVAFLLGQGINRHNSKRKVDEQIFKRYEEVFPYEVFNNFINDTWNMHYNTEFNEYIVNYLVLSENPSNLFHTKALKEQHEKFTISLKELYSVVSLNFSFPGEQLQIMNLQSTAPHESSRYKEIFEKVRILNDKVQKEYEELIKISKTKLFV